MSSIHMGVLDRHEENNGAALRTETVREHGRSEYF